MLVADEATPMIGSKDINVTSLGAWCAPLLRNIRPDTTVRPLVSLCSRLNFRRGVVYEIVDRALHLGEDSPAVSLWVACTLLCFAAAEDERDDCMTEDVRLYS